MEKSKLNKISPNLLAYKLSEFLNLEELIKLLNLNKKTKTIIETKSRLILAFNFFRNVFKKYKKIFRKLSSFLNYAETNVKENYIFLRQILKTRINFHLNIFEYLLLFYQYVEILAKIKSGSIIELQNENLSLLKAKLITIIMMNNKIEKIKICSNIMMNDCYKIIFQVIKQNSILTSISISYCNLDTDTFKIVSEALLNKNCLISIDLSYNNLGYEEAKYISNIIEQNHNLKSIDLSGNDFGDNGLEIISVTIMNSNLE